MQKCFEGGTASRSRIPGIVACGKTGTAQNPHGDDHAEFQAFAPRDNPKIVIACLVEKRWIWPFVGGANHIADDREIPDRKNKYTSTTGYGEENAGS